MKKIMLSLLFATMFCSGLFSEKGLLIINRSGMPMNIRITRRNYNPIIKNNIPDNKAYYYHSSLDIPNLNVKFPSNGKERNWSNIGVSDSRLKIYSIDNRGDGVPFKKNAYEIDY